MSQERLDLLLAQRESIKGQLNSFSSFLTTYSDESEFVQLQLRFQGIIQRFEKFDATCDEIDVLDNSPKNKEERFNTWNEYYKVISIAQQHVANVLSAQQPIPASLPGTLISSNTLEAVSETNESVDTIANDIKLSPIEIPKFHGNLENWLSFKNTFTSLIHNNKNISDLSKLYHLRGALRGEAAKKIRIFTTSADNYARAWQLLLKSYDCKRFLISRHLSKLTHLPAQDRDNHESIEHLVDEANQQVQTLASLGVNISDEIVVQLIEEKFDRTTRLKWEDTLNRDNFPTLDQITQFAYKISCSVTQRESEKSKWRSESGPPTKSRRTDHRGIAKTFVTSTTRVKKCCACPADYHPLYKCNKFLELSVFQKIKIVKNANLCLNCLKSHGKGECKYGNCRICGLKHNTLLHVPKSKTNETVASESTSPRDS